MIFTLEAKFATLLDALLADGKKIQAIKEVRHSSDKVLIDLRICKRIVERYAAGYYQTIHAKDGSGDVYINVDIGY